MELAVLNKMTSMEIAEVTGKRHDQLLRDIRDEVEKLENAGVDTAHKFVERERDGLTGKIPYYELTKEGILQLAARYDAVVRAKLIELATKESIDTAQLSPQLQMFNSLFTTLAKQELETRELKLVVLETKKGIDQAKEVISSIKDTLIPITDNWRENINRQLNKIVQDSDGVNYQEIRSESYKMLEQRAHCDLSARVRNLKQRLTDAGETKTKINGVTKLDVIEADGKLKEIYAGIVKELVIKFVA